MAKFLSDSDVTKLRRLISDVGTLRGQIRTLHDRTKGGERAGAHYIMLTPTGGIPGATGSPLVPGEADCLIQWAAGSGTREVTDTTRPEKVYNLSSSVIPAGELIIAHRDAWGDLWAKPGGGNDTVIVIARATADVGAADASFTAKIKATIAGPPQTFDETITVENLQPGDYLTPTVSGNYRPSNPPVAPNNDHVFVLLEGHNFIAVKANTDSVSWPSAHALKTGWFILQAPGTYVDCP